MQGVNYWILRWVSLIRELPSEIDLSMEQAIFHFIIKSHLCAVLFRQIKAFFDAGWHFKIKTAKSHPGIQRPACRSSGGRINLQPASTSPMEIAADGQRGLA